MAPMRTMREHPISVVIAALAGFALTSVAKDWSIAVFYASFVVLIAVLLVGNLALDERRRSHRHMH